MVGQQQELRSKAAPATVLALTPKTTTKTKGDVFSFDVQIDTAANNVAMAELHLVYDATKLEALSITNGPLAPKIAASGVVGGGTASITVRAESTTKPIKGTGTIAVIRFKAIGATDTPIQVKFDATTFVSGLGESNPNVLTSSTPASVTISAGQDSQVVPTSIPTGTPTPIPELSPTPIVESTESATTEASSSAAQITIQKDESGVSPNTPQIQGVAPPGSTVTIVIHSDDPITVVVTVDENGHWVYTPTQPLTDGAHTIIVTSQNPDGTANTSSSEFTVSASTNSELIEEPMPTSGTLTYTIILISISLLLLLGGVMIQASQIPL